MANCLCTHKGVLLVFISRLYSNVGNKQENNIWVSIWTIHHKSTYIILFLTWHNESISNNENDDLHTLSSFLTRLVYVLLMMSQSIADDITMTRQLWREHVKSDS